MADIAHAKPDQKLEELKNQQEANNNDDTE